MDFLPQAEQLSMIAQFVRLQHGPLPGACQSLPHIGKRQRRNRVGALLKPRHLRSLFLPPPRLMQIGRQHHGPGLRRPYRRTGMSGKHLQELSPFQNLCRLFEKRHNSLTTSLHRRVGKNDSNQPEIEDARRSCDTSDMPRRFMAIRDQNVHADAGLPLPYDLTRSGGVDTIAIIVAGVEPACFFLKGISHHGYQSWD